jgi:hypothetical protein
LFAIARLTAHAITIIQTIADALIGRAIAIAATTTKLELMRMDLRNSWRLIFEAMGDLVR